MCGENRQEMARAPGAGAWVPKRSWSGEGAETEKCAYLVARLMFPGARPNGGRGNHTWRITFGSSYVVSSLQEQGWAWRRCSLPPHY